jgi:beta-mannosidase
MHLSSMELFEKYNVHVGRFMSEYGFQSFPEYKSVKTYAEEKDLALESAVMLAHQKNKSGNQLIKEYMDIYMKEPKDFWSYPCQVDIRKKLCCQRAPVFNRCALF